MPAGAGTIAVVRGEGEGRAADILEFLRRAGNLNEEASRRHLSEAVCVAIDGDQVVGVNSVRPSGISLIGGRRFWVYRSFLAEGSGDLWNRVFTAAFEVLAEEFEETGAGCVGLCVIVDDRALVSRRPEAVLPETELIFAGFLEDGRQVRIRYFWGAAIGPGLPGSPPIDATRHLEYPLEERYRIQPLTDAGEVTAGDVLRLWEREGALAGEEAGRRVREVRLVATEPDEGVVGVSSLYLRRNSQLQMDLWHYRTFVAKAHRMSNLAAQLIFANRDQTEERFLSGEDTRAAGMIFELENEGLKKYFNKALWLPADFTFIGENEKGDHVRVHYFPGARVPALSSASLG